MPPPSLPSGGFRESLKRGTHRAKKWFRPEAQTPTPPVTSPQPEPEVEPGVSLLHPTPTREPPPRPSAQSQPSVSLPQPVPSVNASTLTANLEVTNDVQLAKSDSALIQAAKKAGGDAWSGLKATLRLVEKSSDVFPPLKSAVAGFLGVVDIFETAAQNRKDYEALALHLQSMVVDFREHPEERTSSGMSEALKAMSSTLDKELEHVIERRRRSGFRSHLEAGSDVSDVQECRLRVEILCRELQNKAVLKTWSIVEEQQARARLRDLNAVLQAMYDSSFSDVVGRRTCTPGTRQAVLAGMREWADNPSGPKVYWLNGMAGTGKTTLAYSFCAEMQLAGRLGASFFCSRVDQGSRDVSRIVPTIAYQLARFLPSYREVLIRQIGKDADIGMQKTETQFAKLIRDPLHEVYASVPEGTVVTIDALDECERRDGAQDVLNALLLQARDLPIKFLVTCRPEPVLFNALQSMDESYRSVLHLHDVQTSFVQADIATFLVTELASIALPPEKLERLAEQAGTLFIYAATAVRYIHPKDQEVDFHRRIEDVLSKTPQADTNEHEAMNELYTIVLSAPFTNKVLNLREKKNIRLVLDTAVCAKEPMTVTTMTKLLGSDGEQDINYALRHLRSVLHVSQGANLISTLHASFPDFMLNRDRSKELWCDATKHHQQLSLRCFSTMHHLLRFNICDLESSFVLDEDVPHLADRIDKAIPSELFYACRYWLDHLVYAEALEDVRSALEGFLSNRLLFWMEVLNLRRYIHIGVEGLYRVQAWTQRTGCPVSIQQLARDAAGFVAMFSSNTVSRSTPHIYISALPFWPEQRPISNHYLQKMKGLPKATGTGMRRREAAPLVTYVTPSEVYTVAYSSDSTRIVSGSYDDKIRIWDAHTGKMVGEPLEGHFRWVTSVVFSPNNARIISGSDDNTIRIWDAHTGKLIGAPLKGHFVTVNSVACSPDDSYIVSGSNDKTIRVWDTHTGKMIGKPLKGHNDSVYSVAISSDGARIVSGSEDKTIRVWDARTGKTIGEPLEGHTDSVYSVAISSDGARIVSGSGDNTIRIWDAHTGRMVGEPLQGHTDSICSVAYSSGDALIVSGSHDQAIRVWDAYTGKMIGKPLQGHTDVVVSVAFSSDNARIVSGSRDKTIRVWDAPTGQTVGEPPLGHTDAVWSVASSSDHARIVSGPRDKAWDAHTGNTINEALEGHTGTVMSVANSSNGARIVSGSVDNTIQIWDAYTGNLIGAPLKGHTSTVMSVTYSSNDARIVSGSWDKTIRIWDAHTGKLIGKPLKGHTSGVWSVVCSSDGARIVSGSDDKTIRVWDACTCEMIGVPLQGHTGTVYSVAISPDNARIVSGSGDTTIRVWDAHTGAMIGRPFKGHTSSVCSVAYSSDNSRIVSGSFDETIRVWDTDTGKMIGKPLKGHTDAIWSVVYSSDDERIVSGSEDKTIRVWDARTGKVVGAALWGHTGPVRSVAYWSNGVRIVSGSSDTSIRIATFGRMSNDPRNTWVLNRDGYMSANGRKLVMWVPPDVRDNLMRPRNTAVISTQGSVKVDFTDAHIGDSWAQCYQST